MSLVAHVPKIDVRSSGNAVAPARAAWCEIFPEALPRWDDLLLGTDSWLYQYPLWNEPHRALGLRPRYLAWGPPTRPLAYVCILTLGFRPAKIGLVFRGPTSLQLGAAIPKAALTQLLDWARVKGYTFIRFTHSDPEVLANLAELGNARQMDAFPYFLDYPTVSPDFVVAQHEDDEVTLDSFDREVRRKLRRASEAGYEFRGQDSPEALACLWPLYRECSRRKGFRLERSLSIYMETLRRAQPHNCGRIYSVYLNDVPVGSALVLRDGVSAHCVLAAFAREHRQSAVFLHWKAMRDMYRLGARNYNFGPGPGTLARFKRQFAPPCTVYPRPVTMVLNEPWFQVWEKALFPVAKFLRPALVEVFSHVWG
ncbi:MAG TPA: GNAT family N-acetyltransferase [Candidatus Aquilonibacter sp.]|nr:GNAT family N-acetyltransferase [Candidatus Aquilonibacter sp.]